MTEENSENYVMIFEAPKIEPPEFRLYYEEESGKVLFYTCEKPEGKYIIIDGLTFACARHDLLIRDGRIVKAIQSNSATVSKLIMAHQGTKTLKDDVSILVYQNTDLETAFWKLETYEL